MACLSLVVVMAGGGSLAGPVSANPRGFDPLPWIGLAAQIAGPLFPSAIDKGTDNRLTVMLIGSDWRPRLVGTGERTDTMIFMTINNGVISAVSLPRDVGNVPIAPGVIWKPKINGMFKYYKQLAGGDRDAALDHMRTTFQYTFGIQIDYVVYVRFTGFERLVGEVGGVPVNVPNTIYDKSIVDERYPNNQHGAKFLAQATIERGLERARVLHGRLADQLERDAQLHPRARVRAQPPRTGQQRLGTRQAPAELHLLRDQARHLAQPERPRIASRGGAEQLGRLLHHAADRTG